MDCEGQARHITEGRGGNFEQYPKGGTASVDLEGDPNKSGYLNFDPGELSTINWKIL